MELSDIRHYEPLFGSWRVGELIGDGGFGAVYRVVKDDLGFKQEAAVKIIDVKKDEKLLALVQREVQNLLSLSGHPNIVWIKDCKIEPQKYDGGNDVLILMELLRGLDVKNMSPEQVVKLGTDICRALEKCASNNIIHRDIKAANILVSPDGQYKLSDFGISRTLATHGASTNIGTPEFKAPEVAMFRKYDARADIYSLGLTMYYLLNGGELPFFGEGRDEDAIVRRLGGEEIPPLRGVPAILNSVILKACAFDPDRRFRTASEIRSELENRTAAGFGMPAAAVNITGAPGNVSRDVDEHYRRGKIFYDNKKYDKALEHYKTAAKQGHAAAQFMMGEMYRCGKGLAQDDAKAVEWFRASAEQGHADAQYNLGWMYEKGLGVTKDDVKAAEWFRKAAKRYRASAEQGHADAQYHLGLMYKNGRGVAQDYAKAVEWLSVSAEQGHAAAQYNLGQMYKKGLGVTKDDAKAAEWFRTSAERGYEIAKLALRHLEAR
jgi:hypothetical protein